MPFGYSHRNFPTCLTRIQTLLAGHANLTPYNEVVAIQKYRRDQLPDFTNYGIILSPHSEIENNFADSPDEGLVNGKHFVWNVQIVAIVRNYHPSTSIQGVTPAGVGVAGVGILYHVAMIKDALRSNSLSGYLEVTKYELDGEVLINSIPFPERDVYFHEVIIPWRGESKFEVNPAVV